MQPIADRLIALETAVFGGDEDVSRAYVIVDEWAREGALEGCSGLHLACLDDPYCYPNLGKSTAKESRYDHKRDGRGFTPC